MNVFILAIISIHMLYIHTKFTLIGMIILKSIGLSYTDDMKGPILPIPQSRGLLGTLYPAGVI